MKRIRSCAAFWYEFVVGDDWRIAVAVLVGLAVTAVLARVAHVTAWWVLPVGVIFGLSSSLWLATRSREHLPVEEPKAVPSPSISGPTRSG